VPPPEPAQNCARIIVIDEALLEKLLGGGSGVHELPAPKKDAVTPDSPPAKAEVPPAPWFRYPATAGEVVPESYEAWFHLGVHCQRDGRLEEAREAYSKAIQLREFGCEARSNLGTVLFELGDLAGARKAFLRALRLAPDHPGMLWNIALLAEEQGETAEAEQFYSRLIAKQPQWEDAAARLERLRSLRNARPLVR
jgi:tetratricopeptide (TPR) repeat protein